VIAIEGELVGDATELGIRWHEHRRDVSLEANHPPGTKELHAITKTNGASDAECSRVGQSLVAIVVGSIDTERELSGWKGLGGWNEP
jgi:hypothetical protein